jgi:DNA-binding XRE family transcriptional regulator
MTQRKIQLQISQEEMFEYAEYFRNIRQSLGLTPSQMGEEIGVFRTTIVRWEKGLHIPKRDIDEIVNKFREVVKRKKLQTI